MNWRIKKKRRIRFSMLILHKFNPCRRKMVPITTNDTSWTSGLRLKRVHHRQLEREFARNVTIEKRYGNKSILLVIRGTEHESSH